MVLFYMNKWKPFWMWRQKHSICRLTNCIFVCFQKKNLMSGFHAVTRGNVCLLCDRTSEKEVLSPWWRWKRSTEYTLKRKSPFLYIYYWMEQGHTASPSEMWWLIYTATSQIPLSFLILSINSYWSHNLVQNIKN